MSTLISRPTKVSETVDGNLVLRGHREFAAFLFHLVGKLAGHRAGARAVFLGIGKHAEAFEFRFADEIQQRFKARLGFAGKTDDEGRPQRDAGNAGANALMRSTMYCCEVSRRIRSSMFS